MMIYWKKNLYIMWICQFLAMIGMSAIVPFLPLFVRHLGVKSLDDAATWSGLVFAGPFFVSFFLAPVWGSLGDKYGRKIMVLRAVFGLALAQIVIGFSQNITHLFIGRMLQGVLSGFLPAAMALVAANTPEEKTGYALGILQSASTAGNIFGPLAGGLISDLFGFRMVFFFVSALLIITGILVLFFVKEETRVNGNDKYSFIENWKFILTSKPLLLTSIMITLAAFGVSVIRPIFVFYIETLDIKSEFLPTITGALYSIVGIFSVIGSGWWGRRVEKTGLRRNLIYASLITAVMHVVHAFVFNPYLLIPVRVFLGFGMGALMPLLFTSISRNTIVERRGGVMGVASSFQIIGNMVGPLAGGFSAGVLGLRASFIITGVIYFVITVYYFLSPKDK